MTTLLPQRLSYFIFQRPSACPIPARSDLKVTGLRERHASGGIGDRVSVTARGVDCSRAARLRGEEAIRPCPERLARSQIELVRDRRRRAAVTLEDLTANGVVLAVEAHSGSALNNNCDRERGDDDRVVTQANGLLVEPGAV